MSESGRAHRWVPPTLGHDRDGGVAARQLWWRKHAAPVVSQGESVSKREPSNWHRVGLLLFAVGWGANHFTSLLQVYREQLELDAAAPALLFGMYALGLVPGLLLGGPLSDRH